MQGAKKAFRQGMRAKPGHPASMASADSKRPSAKALASWLPSASMKLGAGSPSTRLAEATEACSSSAKGEEAIVGCSWRAWRRPPSAWRFIIGPPDWGTLARSKKNVKGYLLCKYRLAEFRARAGMRV